MFDHVARQATSHVIQRNGSETRLACDKNRDGRTLLLVVDNEPFVTRLPRAMEKRGFLPETAETVAAGRAIALSRPPAYTVVDLRLKDGSGLDVVKAMRQRRPYCRIVMLTGYGAIATAVVAIRIGATNDFAKPADADDVTNALLSRAGMLPSPPDNPMSAD